MRYPVAIESESDTTSFGVVVPDLPGCFSAGDTLDEPMSGAEDANRGLDRCHPGRRHVDPGTFQSRGAPFEPRYRDWALAGVSVDAALLDDTIERVNITLPRRVLKQLDALARAAGETRSGVIAHLTTEEQRTPR